MKKLVLRFILAACVVASGLEPVRAASELETWCVAQGANWRADTNRCIVFSGIHATVAGAIALLSVEALSNYGTIYNAGAISNDGAIDNFGTIDNYGDIHNLSDIYNQGTIANRGAIDNDGTIGNYGTISNFGTIDNGGDGINNFGTMYNLCLSVFLGLPPSDWGSGVTYHLDNCSLMPLVVRD